MTYSTNSEMKHPQSESAMVKVSDLWMELVRNRPLRVLSFFFVIAFTGVSRLDKMDSTIIHRRAF